MRTLLVVLGLAVLGAFCATASADDFAPPPWRGGPLSVYAEWTFDNAPPPDVFTAGWDADVEEVVGGSHGETLKMFGSRTSHLDFDSADNWTWLGEAIAPCNPEGAAFAANVVNWIDTQPVKYIRVQITYSNLPPDILDGEVVGYEGETELQASFIGHVDVNENQYYEDWMIVPNPDWEQIPIYVPCGSCVEQIVIDTISIPEPGTLVLVALGLVGLLLVRRR